MIAQNHAQTGISLIDVLICLFLMTLILFGFNGIEITMLKYAKNAYFYAIAIAQINNMQERIEATHGQYDIAMWNKLNRELLPNGSGEIKNHAGNYEVKISWRNTNGVLVSISEI